MLVRLEKIEEISEGVTQFFTIRLDENELTEFELFDAKDFPNHFEELQLIYNVISQMQEREARRNFFKDESGAHALPRVTEEIIAANQDDFGLRLYCIFLRYDTVVLSNGDIKTRLNPNDCPNVSTHFRRIRNIARHLDKAIIDKEIDLNDFDPFENFELEI